jgi:uncharacterized protein YndB with AHSA1/START domain/DNA-binding transcriptional ArsR family regulator
VSERRAPPNREEAAIPPTPEDQAASADATGDTDRVFKALADPSRRLLLDRLNVRRGQSLRELCDGLDMARQSVSKHLAILEAADLVVAVRRGREKLHYLNAVPINEIAERWINRYDAPRVHALADLKRALEEDPMTAPTFVYTTYIGTTPEKLWEALTEPAFTRIWWRDIELETDWKVGSPMVWENHGATIADPEQVVLEYDPYRRLSYTWHTFTQEHVEAVGFGADLVEALAAESRSKVTFELEPQGAKVKLTVTQDGFDPGSRVVEMVSEGWPTLLSDLKSYLETGSILPAEPALSRPRGG